MKPGCSWMAWHKLRGMGGSACELALEVLKVSKLIPHLWRDSQPASLALELEALLRQAEQALTPWEASSRTS